MWKAILRQMWKQRKLNLWVMTGLVLITIVIWFIIDPLFVMCYNRWIVPDGFDTDNLYILSLRQSPEGSAYYMKDRTDSAMITDDFYRILATLKQRPEVESYAVVEAGSYPFSDAFNFVDMCLSQNDSLGMPVQSINYYNEGDYFRTFHILSAIDGSFLLELPPGSIYISENMVDSFLTKGIVMGEEMADVDGEVYKVAGIVRDMKVSTYELPGALIYSSLGKIKEEDIGNSGWVEVVFRVKEETLRGISFKDYRERMEKLLRSGNLFTKMQSFNKVRQNYEITYGITNQLRIRTFLILFFLLNMMLGVIGTFWFRCRSRQEEIGLRMALGSTRRKVAAWFFTEGFILSTLAVIIGVLFIIQWVWHEGMYTIQARHMFFTGTGYLTDNIFLHFLCVLAITYLLMMLTVAIGTFFPAWIATKVNPAETLKTE